MKGATKMTCIIGIGDAKAGITYIGGDSAASGGNQVSIVANPKVFRLGEYVLGYTSSFRMGDILELRVQAPKPLPKGVSLRQHLVRTWIDYLRSVYKQLGYLEIEKGVESGGTFLIGTRGHLCQIYGSFQANTPAEGYASVGSGDDLALGALYATRSMNMNPRHRIILALQAAAYHTPFVRRPFKILASK